MNIYVYQMEYNGSNLESTVDMVPFTKDRFEEYAKLYNDSFFEMRRSMKVYPFRYYSNIEQIAKLEQFIYLYVINSTIIGSVSIQNNEIDNLFVNPQYRRRGYGREILKFAISTLQKRKKSSIILHVVRWNEQARKMYEKLGFEYTKIIRLKYPDREKIQLNYY